MTIEPPDAESKPAELAVTVVGVGWTVPAAPVSVDTNEIVGVLMGYKRVESFGVCSDS